MKQERKEQRYESIRWELSKNLRLLRYDDAVKGDDGWAKLHTLRDRGLMITEERGCAV